MAVEDLDLVKPMEIHAGIRAAGQHEFEIQLEAAEFGRRDQISGLAVLAVDDSVAGFGLGHQVDWIKYPFPDDAPAGEPLMRGAVDAAPAGQVGAV